MMLQNSKHKYIIYQALYFTATYYYKPFYVKSGFPKATIWVKEA